MIATRNPIGIEQTTLIDAPLEKVFAYYADPRNLPEIWPSLLEVAVTEQDAGGQPRVFSWVYKMAGTRFSGSTHFTLFEPNKRTVAESREATKSIFDITYTPKGDKTEVHELVQYEIPVPLIGKMAARFLMKMNENEVATIHANLKAKMEQDV